MDSRTLQFLLKLFVLLIVKVSCKHEYHPCTRTCQPNGKPMTCYYKFSVEKYYTMSKACYGCPHNITDCFRPHCIAGDGFERLVTVINRQMPGPGIHVCKGDTVIVDVVNEMNDESTTVHWHGHHQRDTPYMDGVPFITQCPIGPGALFQYKFAASLPGTHFYHSHTGCQRADGLYGPFIIRQPKINETHGYLYDYDLPEHVMIVTDWLHKSGEEKFAHHYHSKGNNKPDTLLINGMGMKKEFYKNGQIDFTPLARFNVRQGRRYRFRIINAEVLYCPIEISIDNHTMIVIDSEGGNINPTVYANSLVTFAGERWDFIVNANNRIGNYWIKMRGLADCGPAYNKAYTLAVLHYEGASDNSPQSMVTYDTIQPSGTQANPLNVGPATESYVTIADMTNDLYADDPALKAEADISMMLSFDFYGIDNSLFARAGLYGFQQVNENLRRMIPQINHVSMKMPSFPPLSQPDLITDDTFCNPTAADRCNETFCFCTYKVDLPLNQTVEIIFVDEGKPYASNHPFHLHGQSFRVVAMEKLNDSTTREEVELLRDRDMIERNLLNPPIKDTVTVPDGGYTVIRFHTSNPGYWLLHCHLDFHVETGMAVLFKIGEDSDLPPVPNNFPTCGNYKIDEYEQETESENEIPVHEVRQDNYVAYKVIMEPKTTPNDFQKLWNGLKRVVLQSDGVSSSSASLASTTSSCLFAFLSIVPIVARFYS